MVFGCLYYRYDEADAEVAPHVADALFAGDGVGAYVFQSAKVTLVGAVEEVLEREMEAADFAFAAFDVGACGEVEEGVGGCGCLCTACHVEVVLAQVAFKGEGYVGVVEDGAVMGDFVFQFGCPAGCRCERQVA